MVDQPLLIRRSCNLYGWQTFGATKLLNENSINQTSPTQQDDRVPFEFLRGVSSPKPRCSSDETYYYEWHRSATNTGTSGYYNNSWAKLFLAAVRHIHDTPGLWKPRSIDLDDTASVRLPAVINLG